MGATEAPLTIREWQNYYADDGSVFALSYLTPSSGVCRNDRAAWRLLVEQPGITGLDLIADHGINAPGRGHDRNAEHVWMAWIIITKPGLLGTLLPTLLRPCDGVRDGYELAQVTRFRASGNWYQNVNASLRDFADAPVAATGSALGKLGGATGGAAANLLVEIALPILIPVTLGLLAYRAVKGKFL